MDLAFPFRFDGRGRTATTDNDTHVRDMLEQLLFTSPGERVNRPDFGSGLLQMVFAPNSPELAAALQFTLRGAVQRWLGDLIDLQDLQVSGQDGALTIDVEYVQRHDGRTRTAQITRTV